MKLRLMINTAMILLICAPHVSAQQESPISLQREAMNKLDHWVGEWSGTGTAYAGPNQRHAFTIEERIQRKIGGAILLVEGLGKSKDESTGEQVVSHEALAVISYDEKAKSYRWRAHDIRGQAIDTELKFVDGAMEWSMRNEAVNASIRFTIRIEGDQWHEIGQASRDGKSWFNLMEMTLQRKK